MKRDLTPHEEIIAFISIIIAKLNIEPSEVKEALERCRIAAQDRTRKEAQP